MFLGAKHIVNTCKYRARRQKQQYLQWFLSRRQTIANHRQYDGFWSPARITFIINNSNDSYNCDTSNDSNNSHQQQQEPLGHCRCASNLICSIQFNATHCSTILLKNYRNWLLALLALFIRWFIRIHRPIHLSHSCRPPRNIYASTCACQRKSTTTPGPTGTNIQESSCPLSLALLGSLAGLVGAKPLKQYLLNSFDTGRYSCPELLTLSCLALGLFAVCQLSLPPSLPPSLPISNCAEIPFIKAVPFVGPDHQLDHGILQGCGFGILIVRICLVSLHISQRIFLPLSPSIYIAIRSQESELCHWSWEIIGLGMCEDLFAPLRTFLQLLDTLRAAHHKLSTIQTGNKTAQ